MKAFAQAGYKPKVAQEISQQWFIVRLVAAGIGVSLFPSSAHSMAIGEVNFVKVVDPAWQTDFSVIWSSDNISPALEAFLEIVREVKNAN